MCPGSPTLHPLIVDRSVLEALQAGEALTAKQIAARFGVKNPTATISDIRFAGFAVYANQHKDTKGRVTTKYRLGKPSRAIVAAGIRAMNGVI